MKVIFKTAVQFVLMMSLSTAACVKKSNPVESDVQGSGTIALRSLNAARLGQFRKNLVKRQTMTVHCRANPQDNFRGVLFEELQKEGGVPRVQLQPLLIEMVKLDSKDCALSSCQEKFGFSQKNVESFLNQALKIVEINHEFKKNNEFAYKILVSSLTADGQSGSTSSQFPIFGGDIPAIKPIGDESIPSAEVIKNALEEYQDLADFVFGEYVRNIYFSANIRYLSAKPLPGQDKIIQPSRMIDGMDEESKDEMKYYYEIFAQLFTKLAPTPGTVYRTIQAPRDLVDDLRERAKKRQTTGLYYKGQAAVTSSTRDPSFANFWATYSNELPKNEDLFGKQQNDIAPMILVINQKTGVSIEKATSGKMKEIVLPASDRYEVVRFEDRSQPNTADPQFSNAKYIVYLVER